ncbi:hypothetical protein EDD16DRAFT_1709534 [Pisolithus croceorrhizus]|nr:hypothetical protein EDD16DRAFT_1709534 [Pisolithus croceorrhizus]KAI6151394.1 hypothetical protein EDD17DRAFT_1765618 [Pisolithus thermaeus]
MVWKDFIGIGLFPTYILLSTEKSTPPLSANPFAHPSLNFTPSPPHAHCHPSPPWTAQALSMYSSPSDTPEASPSYSSTSTSPTSSAPPPTPIGIEDLLVEIIFARIFLGEHVPVSPSKRKMPAFASPIVW